MTSSRIACGRCGEWAIQPMVARSRTDGITLLCPPCGNKEATFLPNGWPIESLAHRIEALEREIVEAEQQFDVQYEKLRSEIHYELKATVEDELRTATRRAANATKRFNDLFEAYQAQTKDWCEREQWLEAALAQSVHQETEPCKHPYRYYFDEDPEPPLDKAIARCLSCKQRFYGYKECRRCGMSRTPA